MIIPLEEDIPVALTADLRSTLESLRQQFPRPAVVSAAGDPAPSPRPEVPETAKFSSVSELASQYEVRKTVAGGASFNILVVTKKKGTTGQLIET